MSIDLSLDRLRRLVGYLPAYTRPTCHIAGTNGKGSVTSILSSILYSSSLSVGCYNSPHLVSIYDCIVINNEPVEPNVYAKARADVELADKEHNINLSSFELLTLTALLIFERAKLDIVVIEVGMGGRLDATNIIPDGSIAVSALAAVDLDHQAFLGHTISEIAREKAGIARNARPFVLGKQKHIQVERVVKGAVEEVGGDLVQAVSVTRRDWVEAIDGPKTPEFSLASSSLKEPPPQPVKISVPNLGDILALLPLYGDHQLDNLGTAVTIVSELLTHPSCTRFNLRNNIRANTISEGIKTARWPGRLSFHSVSIQTAKTSDAPSRRFFVLADGAHNPASSSTLGAYITQLLSLVRSSKCVNLTYILALSHSPPKTPMQTLLPILPTTLPPASNLQLNMNVAVLRFTPPEGMPWIKSVPPSDLRDVVNSLIPGAQVWVAEEGSARQLDRALEWAAGKDGEGLVVLAGSLYLVADFYRFLAAT